MNKTRSKAWILPLSGLLVITLMVIGLATLSTPSTASAVVIEECDPLNPPAPLYGAGKDLVGSGDADLLYEIDPNTGATSTVGPIVDLDGVGYTRVSGIDFNPLDGILYGTGEAEIIELQDFGFFLIAINPCTAEATPLGEVEIGTIDIGEQDVFIDAITDISFDSLGNLFGHAIVFGDTPCDDFFGEGSGSCILQFDDVTGPMAGYASIVGPTDLLFPSGNALGFDSRDTLYHGDDDDFFEEAFSLNTISQTDGGATLVAPFEYLLPIDPDEDFVRPNAFDFNPLTGEMYASIRQGFGGGGSNYLATVELNPDDGFSTVDPVGQTVTALDAIAFTGQALENFIDLRITKGDHLDPVANGGTLTYSGQVTNNGDLPASNVRISDQMPDEFSISTVSIFPNTFIPGFSFECSDTIVNGLLECDVPGQLDPGQVLNYEITGIVNSPVLPNLIFNRIEVTSDDVDQFPGNNAANASTTVEPALRGRVTTSEFGGIPVGFFGATVELCPFDGGPCEFGTTDSQGLYQFDTLVERDYRATYRPPLGHTPEVEIQIVELSLVSVEPVDISNPNANVPVVQDATLTTITDFPDGVTIEPARNFRYFGDNPVIHWQNKINIATGPHCENGIGSFELVQGGSILASGPLTEGPAGFYTGMFGPLFPKHGYATLLFNIDCPFPEPDEEVSVNVYIDPSGNVVDQNDDPIEGATVTLLKSDGDESGPFSAVPDGSFIMSPANRTNPDLTDSAGHFGWDVVPGFYKVTAEAAGCTSTETDVLKIPPPVTDLLLALECEEPSDGNVSDQIELVAISTPASGETDAGGIYPITASIRNTGESLGSLVFVIDVLEYVSGIEPTPFLDNRDAGSPPGVGAMLTVDLSSVGGTFDTGEVLDVVFEILLPSIEPFIADASAFTEVP